MDDNVRFTSRPCTCSAITGHLEGCPAKDPPGPVEGHTTDEPRPTLRDLRWATEFKLLAGEAEHPQRAAEAMRKVADQIAAIPPNEWRMILDQFLNRGHPCAGMVGEPMRAFFVQLGPGAPPAPKPFTVEELLRNWRGIWRVEVAEE